MKDVIVRCRKCVNFNYDRIPESGCGYCELLGRTFYAGDFCSYGEKKIPKNEENSDKEIFCDEENECHS